MDVEDTHVCKVRRIENTMLLPSRTLDLVLSLSHPHSHSHITNHSPIPFIHSQREKNLLDLSTCRQSYYCLLMQKLRKDETLCLYLAGTRSVNKLT